MKKILLSVLLAMALTLPASAHEWRHGHGGFWVAPLVVGGVIGYELAKPPVVYTPPPVVVVDPALPVAPAPQMIQTQVYDYYCRCYHWVWVPVR